MLTRWNDFGLGRWNDLGFGDLDESFRALDTLRREMDRWVLDFNRQFGDPGRGAAWAGAIWPRLNLWDAGAELLLRAELPGVEEKDLNVTVDGSTITISGHRKLSVPEGYTVHRTERSDLQFSRSATLPVKVDPEKVQASLQHGVLELKLAKVPEAQPKRIEVKGTS